MVITLLISIAGVVDAVSVLFDHVHQSTTIIKDRYVKISLSGAEATGKVKLGDTVTLVSVLTNNGSGPGTSIIQLSLPTVNGTSVYNYGQFLMDTHRG